MPPPDADFSFRIVFEKGHGNPRRIFDAASELIDGFEQLDAAIAGSVDVALRPLMVLEDIEASSLRVWLSSILKKVDDQGLRDGEYKKAIGPALVEAKYAAIASPFLPRAAAAGSLPCSSGVGSRSGVCPVAMSMMCFASWLGSLGRLGCFSAIV
jgi:hypothetical protein